MRPVPRSSMPGADLHYAVRTALLHEGHLFSAGERVVLERILALADAPLELFARLSVRTAPVVRVATLRYAPEVVAAAPALVAADLLHADAPDDACLPAFDMPALRAACARLGLSSAGRRGALQARLKGRSWRSEAVLVLPHARLLARVDLLCFGSRADRGLLVAERLGSLRWAEYTPTGGTGLFASRSQMRAHERASRGEWMDADEPLRIARRGPRGHGPCAWRRAVEHVLASGPDADTLAVLAAAGARLRPQWARALLREGRRSEAHAVCAAGAADIEEDLALARCARAVARACGRGFRPSSDAPPTLSGRLSASCQAGPLERDIVLPAAGRLKGRPVYRSAPGAEDGAPDAADALPVEAAVLSLLSAAGRMAIHAENALWRSLYALVFRDLYWLPVPGMLPGPLRSGPLDVGTPGFLERRRAAADARLRALAEHGPEPFVLRWSGERLAGLGDPEVARAWSRHVPGPLAAVVLGRLLREGWSAARGLPDLFIASGNELRIEAAVPSNLSKSAFFAELKTSTDRVSDAQRGWMRTLSSADIRVEIWMVR